jgi:hypothetical protein
MDEPLTISAGRAVTPLSLPLPLVGFMGRPLAREVDEPLETNALLLRCGPEVVLLLSTDGLYVSESLKTELRRRLGGLPDIPDSHILWAASHTHRAPALEGSKPFAGRPDPKFLEEFLCAVAAMVSELIRRDSQGSRWTYATAQADHSINRRRRVFDPRRMKREFRFVPNASGLRQEEIAVLGVRDGRGELAAVIWQYACHPVSHLYNEHVSADYPGAVRAHLRRQLGNDDLPVLFFQGFSGNTRPKSFDQGRGAISRLKRRLYGQVFGLFSPEGYAQWTAGLAQKVSAALAEARPVPADALCARATQLPLGELIEGAPADRALSLQSVAIGPDIVLVGLSAEVVVEYDAMVKKLFGRAIVIPVSCIDTTYGYLPTDTILREGGHEANGFIEEFGLTGRYRPHPEVRVLKALESILPVLPAHQA